MLSASPDGEIGFCGGTVAEVTDDIGVREIVLGQRRCPSPPLGYTPELPDAAIKRVGRWGTAVPTGCYLTQLDLLHKLYI